MSTEDNKAPARRIFEEAASQGNYAVIDEVIAPTFVYRASALPAGKSLKADEITIFRFANGHIMDGKAVWDALGFLQPLGVILPMGQAS
jgi:ketosteroid isomerase-like protein